MTELTINIRLDREDDIFDIDLEADLNGKPIESELDFDEQFQQLLAALGERLVEIVDELNRKDPHVED